MQAIEAGGLFLAGNLESVLVETSQCKKALPWKDLQEELCKYKPEQFTDLLAEATLACVLKENSPFQFSLKTLEKFARDFMEFRAKLGLAIHAADDGPVFPAGVITENVAQLRFVNLNVQRQLAEIGRAHV